MLTKNVQALFPPYSNTNRNTNYFILRNDGVIKTIAMITNDIISKSKKALNLLCDFVIEVSYINYKYKPMKQKTKRKI